MLHSSRTAAVAEKCNASRFSPHQQQIENDFPIFVNEQFQQGKQLHFYFCLKRRMLSKQSQI